ncbi:hypothetical protein CLERM_642 [Coxiella-like endosymbiont]|nr:hypothetical protein CLERM_642 [Coxiella-like endosymbiont]
MSLALPVITTPKAEKRSPPYPHSFLIKLTQEQVSTLKRSK